MIAWDGHYHPEIGLDSLRGRFRGPEEVGGSPGIGGVSHGLNAVPTGESAVQR